MFERKEQTFYLAQNQYLGARSFQSRIKRSAYCRDHGGDPALVPLRPLRRVPPAQLPGVPRGGRPGRRLPEGRRRPLVPRAEAARPGGGLGVRGGGRGGEGEEEQVGFLNKKSCLISTKI